MKTIVFFDGICNFCNKTSVYLKRHNPNKDLKFHSLQSDFAIHKLKDYGINAIDLDSIYVLKNNKIYSKSDAIIVLISHLNWYFTPLYALYLIPKIIRDKCYVIIAKKRYWIFGKQKSCKF